MGMYLCRYTCETCGEREGMIFGDFETGSSVIGECSQCGSDCLGLVEDVPYQYVNGGARAYVNPNSPAAKSLGELFASMVEK